MTVPNETPLSVSDPQAADAAMKTIMAETREQFPDAPSGDPELVDLPGGLDADGQTIRSVRVRELTGADEERIYRALEAENVAHLLSVILECGTVVFPGLPERDTQRWLKKLVVGDREAILLGIRTATYGDEVEIAQWPCPECGEPIDVKLNLREDVEFIKSDAIASSLLFDVPLRKGGKAVVRLPNGEDQEAAGNDSRRNVQERKTILIQRCVDHIEQPNGAKIMFAAFTSYALQMGVADRNTITTEIAKRQPRPKYDDIRFKHDACGKEVGLALSLPDLFLR
jgi:hypothetical protein